MARLRDRLPDNAPGDFYVDSSCIDCDRCRQLAPDTFKEHGGQSIVGAQPEDEAATHRALMALVACPTASIGTQSRHPATRAAQAFPERIIDEVYDCGYAAESSFGATSYFVQRPGGNLLIDSPRAARPLLERLKALGGARYLFLTHRDDVADHRQLARALGCERILHREDLSHATADVEHVLEGDAPIRFADDLLLIPVPGHTRGSVALLYRERFLFSGDHLWASDDGRGLSASRSVAWHSWSRQLASIERLARFDFEWVLPGHGRRLHADGPAEMKALLRQAVDRLSARGASPP